MTTTAAEKYAQHIQAVVADAPPLTSEQADRIAALIRTTPVVKR